MKVSKTQPSLMPLRDSMLQVRPLEAYFIMNTRIYQSPDIYTLVSNRLVCGCV